METGKGMLNVKIKDVTLFKREFIAKKLVKVSIGCVYLKIFFSRATRLEMPIFYTKALF